LKKKVRIESENYFGKMQEPKQHWFALVKLPQKEK
jgi:hypothetical protein